MEEKDKKIEEIRAELSNLKSNLEDLMVSEKEEIKERGREYAEMIKRKGKEVAGKADHYAHEKPWTLMAVGVVAGLVAGMIIKGMTHRCRY